MTTQLSQIIQSYVIRLLIGSNRHEDKDTYQGGDYWYILFNGEKRRDIEHPITTEMIDIALVSKWWLQVVRQRSSMYFEGHLDSVILKSIHSNRHSLFSSDSIQTLKWMLNEKEHSDLSSFNYANQLMKLLPLLQTINLQCKGNVNDQVFKALKSIQKQHPHIVINIEIDINGKRFEYGYSQWPTSLEGFTPNTVSLGTRNFHPEVCFSNGSTYNDDFIQMIKDLQPQSLNLYTDSGKEDAITHIEYSQLFKQLTSIKHLNIYYDFVECTELKELVAGHPLESLKVNILSSILVSDFEIEENSQSTSSYSYLEFHYQDSLDDWIEFCNNISNCTTLKRLHLCDYDGAEKLPIIQEKLTTFQSAFESIWSSGSEIPNIDYLALNDLQCLMSTNMWDTLGHVNCQNITKLLLTNGTVTNEMVLSLSHLIATTSTITVLSINGNELNLNNELVQAFKQNKTITVLDIGGNFSLGNDALTLFSALLYSDTVQYLFLDNGFQYVKHPYFTQSKSLKERFFGYQDRLYFNNNLFTKNQ
ncbi:hypothetical protein DFA_05076 [Cavenderia fasciculata]|uniref:Uncharacterized protein n=1 Tax=Cavenderia fasciculata TaxID=261658 RepID=F4PN93_CACFS|nr:uncharacterized protein DFA_05076 [Cavenderia fasciculata]EGG22946.1 hypothetical protein DFA_05076 [Cavenderia fasciculata]|eukprot:XP_004360797.1 hypothetical protein DFA_05076 [Cavenderia fasciculata]